MSSIPVASSRSRRPLVIGLVIASLVLAAVVLFVVVPQMFPSTITLRGEVQLQGMTNVGGEHDNCFGTGGFSDLKGGAPVAVTDGSGATVALTSLRPGVLNLNGDPYFCGLAFEVEVPSGRGFYGIEVSRRGRLEVSEADLGHVVRMAIGQPT